MTLVSALQWLVLGAFVVVARTAFLQWRKQRTEPTRWLAVTFGIMGVIAVVGRAFPEDADGLAIEIAGKILLAALSLFPYSLFRFTTAFPGSSRALRWIAASLVLIVAAATMALPSFPADDEPKPFVFTLYLGLFILVWSILSGITAVRLWRLGRGQPSLTRRRMQTMAIAAIVLNAGLWISLIAGEDDTAGVRVLTQFLILASALLFLVGFSPPRGIRLIWRNPDVEAFRGAGARLVSAETVDHVTTTVVRYGPKLVGARAGVLTGSENEVVAFDGMTQVEAEAVAGRLALADRPAEGEPLFLDELIAAPVGEGWLAVTTTAFTPFFGVEEVAALMGLADYARLALERAELYDSLAQRETALAHARDDAIEASRLKSQFLANMSHEIRTPLNGVLGMADLLAETNLDAVQVRYVTLLGESGRSLLRILSDILDFSKVEAGKVDIEAIDFELPWVIEGVAELLSAEAHRKGLDFNAEVAPGVPTWVRGDPVRLRQVLANLVGNAVKFTATGYVTVAVAPAADGRVRFEVRDTGVGVGSSTLQELCEPFRQADASTTRRFGGTGLGLAISRQLISLMGGELGLDSKGDQGSVFWFELPLPRVERPTDAADEWAQPITIEQQHDKRRVLLVEDSEINRVVGRAMLERLGNYWVDVAVNGAEAVTMVGQAPYDAILMDCQMPVMDGYQATAAIRRMPSPVGTTPIIAITAAAMAGDAERCFAAGMDDYIPKPLTKAALAAALHRCLDGRTVRQ